jgi:RNA polymerase sigma-70 factor (ECF subfamily)
MIARDDIDRIVPALRRTAQALCAGPDAIALGDEITRDALRRALRGHPPPPEQVRLEVWVTVILVDSAREAMGRRGPEARFAPPDPSADNLRERVSAALAALPHEEREALTLVSLARFSYVEAAAALGLTMSQLMAALTAGRDGFAAALAAQGRARRAPTHLRVVK